jgi:hypothetical protein
MWIKCFSCNRLYDDPKRLIIDSSGGDRHICWGCLFPTTKEEWSMEDHVIEDFVKWRLSGSVKEGTAKFEWAAGYFVMIDGKKIGPYQTRQQAIDKLKSTDNANEEGGLTMDTKQIMTALDEIFSTYTFVRVGVSKKIQEVQYEPYTISVEQGMIVPIDDKDEAIKTITDELDQQLVNLFMERGINIIPQEE